VLGLIFQGVRGWKLAQTPEYVMTGIGSAVLGIWLFGLIGFTGILILGPKTSIRGWRLPS
jgi:hypothetical protein